MRIQVVGSVNLDIVASGARLPRPGETVTGARIARHPGGKGANQALAARRLGAEVGLIACVGADAAADEALVLLRAAGIDLAGLRVDSQAPTGVALIAVAANGENQIVVAPGANDELGSDFLVPPSDALIVQLEVPLPALQRAASAATGLFVMNLAPAMDLPRDLLLRADLLVLNETEAEFYGDRLQGLPARVIVTAGGRGACMLQGGRELARARPPTVTPVDTTGAGDTFVAALTVALLEGRDDAAALAFACAAGAAATLTPGAQSSLPDRVAVLALLDSDC
jgi:ribokinase